MYNALFAALHPERVSLSMQEQGKKRWDRGKQEWKSI